MGTRPGQNAICLLYVSRGAVSTHVRKTTYTVRDQPNNIIFNTTDSKSGSNRIETAVFVFNKSTGKLLRKKTTSINFSDTIEKEQSELLAKLVKMGMEMKFEKK